MPYKLSTRKGKDGKMMACMTSKDSGKTYCYRSVADRTKGMQMHEAFRHGFVMTQKGKK